MDLKRYLSEIGRIDLLAPAEEAGLWRAYKEDRDPDSRRRLIESYQPLVFKAAAGWRADDVLAMDMLQEGTVGLIEAVENYDHNRGVAFSLYAMHRIRGRMLKYLAREGKRDLTYIDGPMYNEDGSRTTLEELLPDTAPAVSSQAERKIVLEQLYCAMGRLPGKEQEVLSGVYLNDRQPKEMAARLEVSVAHVYRLQKQGIQRIRGMMSQFMRHWQM